MVLSSTFRKPFFPSTFSDLWKKALWTRAPATSCAVPLSVILGIDFGHFFDSNKLSMRRFPFKMLQSTALNDVKVSFDSHLCAYRDSGTIPLK